MPIVILKNVRIVLFKNTLAVPGPRSDDKPNERFYQATFLLPRNHPQLAQVNKAIDAAMEEKFPGKGAAVRKAANAMGKICLRDGDTKDAEKYPQFQDMWFMNASLDANKGKPRLYGTGGLTAGEVPGSTIYSGCYVNAAVSFYGYDNVSKGCAAGLGDVQFIRDGDAFGGGAPPRADENSFGAVEADTEHDSLCD